MIFQFQIKLEKFVFHLQWKICLSHHGWWCFPIFFFLYHWLSSTELRWYNTEKCTFTVTQSLLTEGHQHHSWDDASNCHIPSSPSVCWHCTSPPPRLKSDWPSSLNSFVMLPRSHANSTSNHKNHLTSSRSCLTCSHKPVWMSKPLAMKTPLPPPPLLV